MTEKSILLVQNERILSIDFMRGFTMFVLVSSFGQLFDPHSINPVVAFLGQQLDHAEWEGLKAWDLVQPFFMFIVGVAMPFSFSRKWAKGESWNETFRGALKRSLLLLFLGWLIGSSESHSSYTNVLAQLSVTYLVAFLMMRKPVIFQLVISFALIIFNDAIYQLWPVEGFNHPYTADHNFGSWFDIFLTGGLSEDRWVAFNAISTTAHTIWGVLAGQVLMKNWPAGKKIKTLVIAGLIGIVSGYLLRLQVPMIKRICTSSFILASGGWCFLALAICYQVIDVWNNKKVLFFAVVGMNPLFIYMLWHARGTLMAQSLATPVVYRLFGWGGPQLIHVMMVLSISFIFWYICYFLYKHKIFIRI